MVFRPSSCQSDGSGGGAGSPLFHPFVLVLSVFVVPTPPFTRHCEDFKRSFWNRQHHAKRAKSR